MTDQETLIEDQAHGHRSIRTWVMVRRVATVVWLLCLLLSVVMLPTLPVLILFWGKALWSYLQELLSIQPLAFLVLFASVFGWIPCLLINRRIHRIERRSTLARREEPGDVDES